METISKTTQDNCIVNFATCNQTLKLQMILRSRYYKNQSLQTFIITLQNETLKTNYHDIRT